MIIGASGVGRSPLRRSVGELMVPSMLSSCPSSLCIGWSEGEGSSITPEVKPRFRSVRDEKWSIN